jgi:hypothetical protein
VLEAVFFSFEAEELTCVHSALILITACVSVDSSLLPGSVGRIKFLIPRGLVEESPEGMKVSTHFLIALCPNLESLPDGIMGEGRSPCHRSLTNL